MRFMRLIPPKKKKKIAKGKDSGNKLNRLCPYFVVVVVVVVCRQKLKDNKGQEDFFFFKFMKFSEMMKNMIILSTKAAPVSLQPVGCH